jgi:hypothetical protein
MEEVVEDLRARLRAAGSAAALRDLPEARLEIACTWGSGHLLLTGSDRREIDGLLDRVIRKIDPMGTVRAQAGDPTSTVDRLIALLDSEHEVTGHLDRRKALLQLLARAQEARKSIFVVVDDADDASVEELERLRTTLEVAPDAIERLRLVLVGDASLPAKLDTSAARALSSRITSRIRVGEMDGDFESNATSRGGAVRVAGRGSLWIFASAASVCFAVIAYATVLLLSAPDGLRFAHLGASLSSPNDASTESTGMTPVGSWHGLRGDEAFLNGSLGIPIDARWVTGSALFALPEPEPVAETVVAVAVPVPPAHEAPPQVAAKTPARKRTPSSIGTLSALVAKKAPAAAPLKAKTAAPSAAPSSSIAALRSHFE